MRSSIFRMMGADDNGVIDPRSPLDKANRDQMREFAEKNGIKEITWDLSGDEMRFLLKKRGIYDIGVRHILGARPVQADVGSNPNVPTVNLEEEQRREFERRADEREANLKSSPLTPFGELLEKGTRAMLAKECKRRGIKMQRTDTKEKLIERLNGQSHAA